MKLNTYKMIDRFFKDIAFIYNPNADQNRRRVFRKERIRSLLPRQILFIETSNPEEMKKSLLQEKELVVIAGGDGSVQTAINYFITHSKRMPIFAVIPCGVVNFIANLLSSKTNPYKSLMKLISALHRKKTSLTTVDTLKIEFVNDVQYGFVFTNGGFFKFFQLYYDKKTGETGIVKVLSIVLKSLSSFILKGSLREELLSPKKMSIFADSKFMGEEHTFLVVSSVNANFLGLKPFRFFSDEGSLYMICGKIRAEEVFKTLPLVYFGRKWKTAELKTNKVNEIEIKNYEDRGCILDGEIFFSQNIKITPGVSVRFLMF